MSTMLPITDLIVFHYDKYIEYLVTALNAVGATTSLTLRTLPTPAGNIAYVKKFGADYAIGDITNAVIEHPRSAAGNEWIFTFYGWNGTAWVSMGVVEDAGGISTYSDGAEFAATKVKIVLHRENLQYSITNGDHITLTTDTDPGGLSVMLSGESGTVDLTWYLASSGSTYYDEDYKYGGYRHTPVLDSQIFTYFHPYDAYAALNSADDGVCILDSEHYSFPYKDTGGTWRDELTMSRATTYLYSANGYTPTIEGIVGASVYREVTAIHNNSNSIFVSKTGLDANAGTYQLPKLTHAGAIAAIVAQTYIITMDNENYYETITFNINITFESLYGYIPTFSYETATNFNFAFGASGQADHFFGYNFDGANLINYGLYFLFQRCASNIYCNSFYNYIMAGTKYQDAIGENFSANIKYNKFYNNNIGLSIGEDSAAAITGNIMKNYFYNNIYGIFNSTVDAASTAFNNNIFYLNTYSMYYNLFNNANATTFQNNTITKSNYGIYVTSTGGGDYTGTCSNNIVYWNTIYDLYTNGAGTTGSLQDSHYGTKTVGWSADAECQTVDPLFCEISINPYILGIQPNKATTKAYRSGTDADDRGAHFRLIEINESTIEINGIIFDGNSQYNNAIYKLDTANHTAINIKWCTFQNFQGIAIDYYEDSANSSVTVANCDINNNGCGIAFYYGGNTVDNSLIYRNSVYGIWADYTTHVMTNISFYNNQYNVYLESSISGLLFKNNISYGASLYGIYSEASMVVTYSCITDAINSYVDITATNNITDDPQFVNVISGSEDFNLKSAYNGYGLDSPCIGIGDDSKDLGCYDISRSITEQAYKQYQLEHNPSKMDEDMIEVDKLTFEDAKGNYSNFASADKMVFPFKWNDDDMTGDTQRLKMKYFAKLKPTFKNGKTESECEILMTLLPDTHYGANVGVIDAIVKTLTDTSYEWNENSKEGWFVNVIWETVAAGGTILAAGKTLTDTGQFAGKTYTGFWVYTMSGYNKFHYYYIKSHTDDALTLSDPNGDLINESAVTYYILKWFKIESNTKTVLTLTDNDSELVSGTYTYYIDHIKVRSKAWSDYNQKIFDYATEKTKSEYGITFQEVD